MKYEFVGLRTQTITGVKNPLLTLIGTKDDTVENIIITEDNIEIDYTEECEADENDFHIVAPLNCNSKMIRAYAVKNGERYLMMERKMSVIERGNHKIHWIIKSFFLRIFDKLDIFRAIIVTIFKGIRYFWKEYHFIVPFRLWPKYWKDFKGRVKVRGRNFFYNPFIINEYNDWLKKHERNASIATFEYNPLISILIPVYNVKPMWLDKCIDSILAQTYTNFEVCLVDDASPNSETIESLKSNANKDKRIKVKFNKVNGHISKTTNDALKMANGEYVALMDDDDELSNNALYEVVKALNSDKTIDFIYSDEDKFEEDGRRSEPNFKPDYSPDTLLSSNYMSHLGVIRKSIMESVGGEQVGLEGAQDYDLYLKIVEKTKNIYHIPKILYHWRKIPGSTSMTIDNKNYAIKASITSINSALKRRNIAGHAELDEKSCYYKVVYDLPKKLPLVSIIIPLKDYADITRNCLSSIYENTTYKNFEIIIMNNNSVEKSTFELFDEYRNKYKNFKVIDANYEFNYSKINNEAVMKSKGDYICLLNNDTEIITPNWIEIMLGYAMQNHIGAVGAKLLYPDMTVQHCGIVMGLGGVASHPYTGADRNDIGMYGRLRVPYNYAGVTAACLFIEKKKYNEVNGLDENLKVAYNDVDMNLKLLKYGYYNVVLPQVELKHYESKSRGMDTTTEKYKRFKQEEKYMYEKWNNIIKNDPFYNRNFTKNYWFKLDR